MNEFSGLSLAARPGRGCTVVHVAGELDMSSAPELRAGLQQVLDDGGDTVVLDLAHVRFIDSSGLGTIVLTYRELQSRDGRLCLAAVQPFVLKVLELTSVDTLVTIYDSVDAAEEDLAGAPER